MCLLGAALYFGGSYLAGLAAYKAGFPCEWIWTCVAHGIWILAAVLIIGRYGGGALLEIWCNDD